MTVQELDVVVVGAGQAGLAAGFYLRRTALRWAILDAEASATILGVGRYARSTVAEIADVAQAAPEL
jgi:cation diffusion facilitator CzcD-associated flavoprotein CzcO